MEERGGSGGGGGSGKQEQTVKKQQNNTHSEICHSMLPEDVKMFTLFSANKHMYPSMDNFEAPLLDCVDIKCTHSHVMFNDVLLHTHTHTIWRFCDIACGIYMYTYIYIYMRVYKYVCACVCVDNITSGNVDSSQSRAPSLLHICKRLPLELLVTVSMFREGSDKPPP
jgi:hypothetical protein